MHHPARRVLVVLALALFVPGLSATVAQSESDEATEPVLHLVSPAGNARGAGNFTTFPSNETNPFSMRPTLSQPADGRVEWWWSLFWLPENGTVAAGTRIEAVVYVAFGGTLPVPDPLAPTDAAAYRVTGALDTEGTTFAAGETAVPVPVDPMPESAVHEVTIVMDVTDDASLPTQGDDGTTPVFRFIVGLEGVTTSTQANPLVFVASSDTPSRISVPGFPWQAYHEFESEALALEACHERVLQQQPCEDETTPSTTQEGGGAFLGGGPGIGFLVAIAALCGGAVVAARRIVP